MKAGSRGAGSFDSNDENNNNNVEFALSLQHAKVLDRNEKRK